MTNPRNSSVKMDIPQPLVTLLQMYIAHEHEQTTAPEQLVVESIETFVTERPDFLRFMEKVKSTTPKAYKAMGGDYLDGILQRGK